MHLPDAKGRLRFHRLTPVGLATQLQFTGDVRATRQAIRGETSSILLGERQNQLCFIVGDEAASKAQRGAKADYYGLPCRRCRRHSVLEGV
jgi:hypothetical protein